MIGVTALLLTPSDVFRSALSCMQLGYLVNIALSVQSFAIAGLAVWLAWLGWGLPGQFAANVLGLALFSALTVYFVGYYLAPYRRVSAERIDNTELWILRSP